VSVDWYEHALYYDVLFGWDPAIERDFVLACSERYGLGAPRRVLEPMCGTGRLLGAFAGAIGFDLSPGMVAYARRRGHTVFRGDASAFAVAEGAFELVYCLIDSFRHLQTQAQAVAHLRAAARALRSGGVYVLGFDVTGGLPAEDSVEEWDGKRSGITVKGRVETLGDFDASRRLETMQVTLEVRDQGRRHRLESRQPLRTYTPDQVRALLDEAGQLELVACFDRQYDVERPRELEAMSNSVVLVLRRGEASS
jgi:SAM-dependent methyltransferase